MTPMKTLVATGAISMLLGWAACGPGDDRAGDADERPRGGHRPEASEAGGHGAGGDGGSSRNEGRRRGGGRGDAGPGDSPGHGGPPGAGMGDPEASRGVPVEVARISRDSISLFFETNGTLEAENEVDLVSRVAGPIVLLAVEEGDRVREGQVLARLDDRELRAQLEVAKVRLDEAEASYRRTNTLFDQELVSRDLFDQARAGFEAAKAEHDRLTVQLTYTEIRAPFGGLVVERYVKFAEFLQNGARLFRLSDFDPLLCPIQVPERQLRRLRQGQRASLQVEAFGDRKFHGRVQRIRPVVDAATGTIEVTLEVDGGGVLRPGMFASVALEMERREHTVVVPKAALALDSLRPTVFVLGDGVAERREVEIGFRNDQQLEVLAGLEAGEHVVVVGQDGLADGTPVEVLAGAGDSDQGTTAGPGTPGLPGEAAAGERRVGRPDGAGRRQGAGGPEGPGGPGFFRDLDLDDPEQLERARSLMRQRGLSDPEIDQRLERMRRRRQQGGGSAADGPGRDG